MNCMKCGREIPLGQVFCKDCLTDMEAYPVKPDTPVLLPIREDVPSPRRSQTARRVRKPENQVRTLRAAVVWLGIILVVLATVFFLTVTGLMKQIQDSTGVTLPGQNYSTVEST